MVKKCLRLSMCRRKMDWILKKSVKNLPSCFVLFLPWRMNWCIYLFAKELFLVVLPIVIYVSNWRVQRWNWKPCFYCAIPWKMLMNKAHCNFKISQFPWNIQSWPKLGCFARKWLEKSQWKSKYSLLQCNKFSQSPLRCLIDKRENFKSSSVKLPWRQCCPHFIP